MVPRLPYPIDMKSCTITQRFGEHPEDYAQFGFKGHNGIDLAPYWGYRGSDIVIMDVDAGTITWAGDDGYGMGNHVEITHPWGITKYGHMVKGSLKVKVGDKVVAGSPLGIMGNTGNSSGVHLHFGVYPKGEPKTNGYSGAVDPLPYMSGSVTPPIVVVPPPVVVPGPGPIVIPPFIKPSVPGYVSSLKPGTAEVIVSSVACRLSPSRAGTLVGYLRLGTKLVITGDAVTTFDNIVWRKVEAWVAEWDGTTQTIK